MYTTLVTSPDKALSHLFLHCCFRDGEFTEEEINEVSEKLAKMNLHQELNFKDELVNYKSYRDSIILNEKDYLQYLLKLLNPTNEAALYSYCVELGLSDAALEFEETKMLETLGSLLGLDEAEQNTIQKLMVQRKVVESQKFF
jgi:uncharacterized tellurite resistance protein B-like protein